MYWGASLWIALNAKMSNLNSILKLYKIINPEEVSGEGLDGPENLQSCIQANYLSGYSLNSKSDFKCKIIHFV